MSHCEADNVVMIQSLSFSEPCVSILSPVNLTLSERAGGSRGYFIFLGNQNKKYDVVKILGKTNFTV